MEDTKKSVISSFMSTSTLHVVGEIIALTGVVIYFSQKNSTLMKHIDELAARIEEQEDTIQKHEELLNKIVSNMKKTAIPAESMKCGVPKAQAPVQQVAAKPKPKPKTQPTTPQVAHVFTAVPPQVFNLSIPTSHSLDVLEEYNNTGITEIQEGETEEDLDMEIHEELSELQS
jgi:hypothetical protein